MYKKENKRRTSMTSAGFEPAIPAIKRLQANVLDRTAAGIRHLYILPTINYCSQSLPYFCVTFWNPRRWRAINCRCTCNFKLGNGVPSNEAIRFVGHSADGQTRWWRCGGMRYTCWLAINCLLSYEIRVFGLREVVSIMVRVNHVEYWRLLCNGPDA
jgi:hypothetical protein